MIDNAPEIDAQAEPPADEQLDPVAEEAPESFSADYVRDLREEAAAHRIKAKRIDDANARLVAAYAIADGRLVDVEALTMSEYMLDDDGLVDPEKVAGAIADLIVAKPYLASRKPTTPLPQGVREDVPTMPGLFDFIRERA
jgi:hypothetical protein